MTRKELETLTQGLVDRTLSHEEHAALEAEIRTNPDSLAFFHRSLETEILLKELLGVQKPTPLSARSMSASPRSQTRRHLRRSVWAAAALFAVLATVLALVMVNPSPPSMTSAAVPGAIWGVLDEAGELNPLRRVAEGDSLRVKAGMVRLTLDSGVKLAVQGPATVSFPKLAAPMLHSGWLWVDTQDSGQTLEIVTPHHRVRNMGTCFGLRAKKNGDLEVHLMQGELEVHSLAKEGTPTRLLPSERAVLFSKSGSVEELALAANPFPHLPELLTAPATYPVVVLGQGPAGYWRLEDEPGQAVANSVSGGIRASAASDVRRKAPGLNEAGGGLGRSNRGFFMTGHEDHSLINQLTSDQGVAKNEGAVAFWIRREPGMATDEVLWLAGDTRDDSSRNPKEAIMHTQISGSGSVEFFIENKEFDILLSSNFGIADGQWHQVVASWGPQAVELYVDGRRVERVDDFGRLQSGTLKNRYVRFGKPSEDLKKQGKQAFTGWVDEIALWNRPLTPIEVHSQYRAARR